MKMTDTRKKSDDMALDSLFEAARDAVPEPTQDFMARLAADADAEAPNFEWAAPTVAAPSFFTRASRWITATGLGGSAALGVWIGVASTDLLNELIYVDAAADDLTLSDFLPAADLASLAEIGADG